MEEKKINITKPNDTNQDYDANETNKGKMKNLLEWVKSIVLAILLALLITQFIRPTMIHQTSMEPTLHSESLSFLSVQAYSLFGEPKRGDIVVFKSNLLLDNGDSKNLIKRIIGLPGDKIVIKNGYAYVNGAKLKEDYLMSKGSTYVVGKDIAEYIVPDGKFFAMGDNREVSVDCRAEEVGFPSLDDIIGKVITSK